MMTHTQRLPDFSSFRMSFRPLSDRSLTVLYVNIRGIREYWEEFKVIVHSLDSIVDVFVLTEINVPSIILDQF